MARPRPAQEARNSITAPAWALCAVSSEGQAETLSHQRRWAEEAASSRGWRLTRVVEGVATGKNGPRRIVRDLLVDLRALDAETRPKYLLMVRCDRLGRGSIVESQIVLRDLMDLGVGVVTRDQGEVKLDSAMDELISAATLAVARHENDIRSDKMLGVRRRKREAGEPMGTAPYGLLVKAKKYVPDRERAPVVREAFNLRLKGNGYQQIATRLTAIALPQAFLNGKTRVVNWTPTRVSILLKQRAYVGTIIDEGTFARAQRVAQLLTNSPKRNAIRRYPWPLAGSMRCYCGRTLKGMACGIEPWRYRYYTCVARWNHDGKLRLVRAERVEEQFVALLEKLKASPDLVVRYGRKAATPVAPRTLESAIRDLKMKLSEINRRREQAWELHSAGRVRSEDVQERLDDLANQREDVARRLAVAQEQLAIAKATANRQHDVEALIKRAAQTFRNATVDEQNAIARAASLELGGLTIDAKGKLTIGTPK